MSQQKRINSLVCDAGGTNCSFALVTGSPDDFHVIERLRYSSQEITSFEDTLVDAAQRLTSTGGVDELHAACISAAGPVRDGKVQLTNTRWAVDERSVESRLGIPSRVINDIAAISYAIPTVHRRDETQCTVVHRAGNDEDLPDTGGTRAVVAAGTGLGVGFLVGAGRELQVFSSEGGHADVSAFDEETHHFRAYVEKHVTSRPDAETFISGRGLSHAAACVTEMGGFDDTTVGAEIRSASASDTPALVSRHAPDHPDAATAMRMFLKMYGRFSAGLALTLLSYEGVFLAGGVTARNIDRFSDGSFMSGFLSHDRGEMLDQLRRIPVFALADYGVSLSGAAYAAYLLTSDRGAT